MGARLASRCVYRSRSPAPPYEPPRWQRHANVIIYLPPRGDRYSESLVRFKEAFSDIGRAVFP